MDFLDLLQEMSQLPVEGNWLVDRMAVVGSDLLISVTLVKRPGLEEPSVSRLNLRCHGVVAWQLEGPADPEQDLWATDEHPLLVDYGPFATLTTERPIAEPEEVFALTGAEATRYYYGDKKRGLGVSRLPWNPAYQIPKMGNPVEIAVGPLPLMQRLRKRVRKHVPDVKLQVIEGSAHGTPPKLVVGIAASYVLCARATVEGMEGLARGWLWRDEQEAA